MYWVAGVIAIAVGAWLVHEGIMSYQRHRTLKCLRATIERSQYLSWSTDLKRKRAKHKGGDEG